MDKRVYRQVQRIAKETMSYAARHITAGMNLRDVRKMCEEKMLALGADCFWYWDIGAFVFAGDETAISVSGPKYATSDRILAPNDILTIDLSPQCGDTWGDYARTLILQNGTVVDTQDIQNAEWQQGLNMEALLHSELHRYATPETTLETLHRHMNRLIGQHGFCNLDFAGNLGHTIVRKKQDRVYIEKGSTLRLGDAGCFTFEPHIGLPGSHFGYKMENIYYFEDGVLQEL